MLTAWWCCKGDIHYSLLQPGQAVTSESYCCNLDLIENRNFIVNTPGLVRTGPSFPRLDAPARAIAAHGPEKYM
ncbi:hypothetical protein Y032_0079g1294 [Ancylostoma ceylanicum]|uniref:Uncharacterized protein n=1 Tax=Ancylostoma ceylanicum TaxID=53326 RepID=A0A016TSJ0_9BILA|nr:hypothetical protein Y032_0079g1294 [Ancylostoma ceylanicum]